MVEALAEFQHPLGITTKNHLVIRDIDLLAPLAERGLSVVVISITTLDRQLARDMEPRASTPARRFDAIRALSRAGIPVIVSVAPIIPGLTDHEIESIMEGAAEAGVQYAHYSHLKDLFKQWLAAEWPDRAQRVMSLVRQTRRGKENDTRFGMRMVGEGPVADMLIDSIPSGEAPVWSRSEDRAIANRSFQGAVETRRSALSFLSGFSPLRSPLSWKRFCGLFKPRRSRKVAPRMPRLGPRNHE